jgi:hypothetical protein
MARSPRQAALFFPRARAKIFTAQQARLRRVSCRLRKIYRRLGGKDPGAIRAHIYKGTIGWVIEQYLASVQFKEKSLNSETTGAY